MMVDDDFQDFVWQFAGYADALLNHQEHENNTPSVDMENIFKDKGMASVVNADVSTSDYVSRRLLSDYHSVVRMHPSIYGGGKSLIETNT